MASNIECLKAANEILGDRWTPQLLRAIHNGHSLRFCQIQDTVGGINPRTLSTRLNMLEANGIISSIADTTPCYNCYQLTKKGQELIPILTGMGKWSKKYRQST